MATCAACGNVHTAIACFSAFRLPNIFQVSLNAASKDRLSIYRRALCPIADRFRGSATRDFMALKIDWVQSAFATSPVSPGSMFSTGPPRSVTMTGSPDA